MESDELAHEEGPERSGRAGPDTDALNETGAQPTFSIASMAFCWSASA